MEKETIRFALLAALTLSACGGAEAHDPSTPNDLAIAPVASTQPGAAATTGDPADASPVTSAQTSDAGADFGSGGLGLRGTGESAGGSGEGIGLGNIGTLGTSTDGGAPTSTPRLGEGATDVNGGLPPEVIRRIVRQNYGRFRLCYEMGLKRTATLAGEVIVKFTIDAKGSVSNASDGGSTLPDPAVVSCVLRAFGNLSFPQPEGGVVVVKYPIKFAPQ